MLRAGAVGRVNLYGPPGSGKSFAINWIKASLEPAAITWIDLNKDPGIAAPSDRLTVFTTHERSPTPGLAALEMAPWTEDDCIDYLIATHRQRCASVLDRVHRSGAAPALEGLPELWRIVLDVLAADDSIVGLSDALRWAVQMELAHPQDRLNAGRAAIDKAVFRQRATVNSRVDRLLRHRVVQLPVAAEAIVGDLASNPNASVVNHILDRDLVREIALLAAQNAEAHRNLLQLMDSPNLRYHSTIAGILLRIDPRWRPRESPRLNFASAWLEDAQWDQINLSQARLAGADLRGANLCGANLDHANLSSANLGLARLRGASLNEASLGFSSLIGADLSGARGNECDFSQAWLTGTMMEDSRFHRANFSSAKLDHARLRQGSFTEAVFEQCEIQESDLFGADLSRARFANLTFAGSNWDRAVFREAMFDTCNLEDLELEAPDFQGATLKNCVLTDSILPGANFRGANLRGAGLAGIEWPGADLRDADLTHASFHLGSTRSGLVGSTIPCEGSKTGFYTDEFNEQDYKPPEEIRKANLCGADLRGAILAGVDFYLVDLRGTKLSAEQRDHVVRCGAILGG